MDGTRIGWLVAVRHDARRHSIRLRLYQSDENSKVIGDGEKWYQSIEHVEMSNFSMGTDRWMSIVVM